MFIARDENKIVLDDEITKLVPNFDIKTIDEIDTGRKITYK